MARISMTRRLSTAARWPVGVTLTSWRYLWRTTPMSRWEVDADAADHRPPELPAGTDMEQVQTPADGVGPLYHRIYRIRIAEPQQRPAAVIEQLVDDLDAFAPSEFATFQRTKGEGRCRPGHEYVVRMPGPWDGPVRVVEVTPSSVRLATLDGHLEAGQIEFRAHADGDGRLVFTIESWARSATRLTDFLYARARMSKEVQTHMWVSFLERVLKRAGGSRSGRVDVHTRRVDEPGDG